jgi:hypothetical protein
MIDVCILVIMHILALRGSGVEAEEEEEEEEAEEEEEGEEEEEVLRYVLEASQVGLDIGKDPLTNTYTYK